ncbi:glucose 1-dehydrogenase [Methylobacillus arboreus]|uniref:SDR family NAD(P)-dependent oxidoreductase n=1 Tax=Methylobacillus arboreus TaxID=755170 RepID=UPI001E2E11E3|nr:glucose 1-dehydrogenase [Methylobacillus arboreus]MCB5191137.1 glucose 1-dehydrogenase [Methylobacillus arboreus]
MAKKLEGKVAVVTGASKGIGAGIAKALAAEGASIIVNYASSKEGADKVVTEIINAGGKAFAVQGDVSKQADITNLFSQTKSIYGQLDILVNNAGVFEFSPIEQVDEAHFHKQFNLNVLGLLLTIKEALPLFGENGGSIINISSSVTTLTPPNSSVYTATKGAVDALTGVLAKELGARKIRVNAINPGLIATEGAHAGGFTEGDTKTWVESTAPLGRIGQVDDIAPSAVYLASEDSKYLTGETINISGGMR